MAISGILWAQIIVSIVTIAALLHCRWRMGQSRKRMKDINVRFTAQIEQSIKETKALLDKLRDQRS